MNNGHDLGPDAIKAQQGNVDIALGHKNGKVVLAFYRPVDNVHFDPSNAVMIAKQMLDLAQVCGANIVLQVPKRPISREHRNRMITRVTHVLRSMQEKGRPPKVIAQHAVDTLLSMVD